MTDYFALFGQVRRPWLDAGILKARFLEMSGRWHPDHLSHLDEPQRRAAQERYAGLNSAYQCLREPRERLRHLLQLESDTPITDIQQVPEELVTDFMDAGKLCRQADAHLRRKAETTSPLLKVEVFAAGQELGTELREFAASIEQKRDAALSAVRELDLVWDTAASQNEQRAGCLQQVRQLHHRLAFYDRWLNQLREKSTQLIL
ncbi:MAG TPA: hypothetical protein VEH04_19845 [Verrucomicrobiae bacterium]|nr:hypothetical protein [Verrucomicrobiae bacterium]